MTKRLQLDLPLQRESSPWARARLGDIAEVRLGRQRSPARAVGDHMRPYMRAANVTWEGISIDDVKEMDFTPHEAESYELHNGDILLSEASGSPHEVGKPAIWRDEVPGACFQNTLIRVRAPGTLVRYLHLHFLRDALTGRFSSASRGVGIHHLGAKTMDDWPIDLPPPGEQRRICDAVDEHLTKLDAAIAGLKRVQANLKRYRASVLKAAVEGRLVPTEAELARQEGREYEPASVLLQRILVERRRRWEEAELAKMKAKGKTPRDDSWKEKYPEPAAPDIQKLPALPEGWRWATVEQLGFIASGQTPKDIEMRAAASGDIPWYRVGDMNIPGNEDSLHSASVWLRIVDIVDLGLHVRPPGTIVFPKRGGAIRTNKKRVLAIPSAYDLNTMGIIPVRLPDAYLQLWFQSLDLSTISDGSNVPQINHGDIAPLPVPIPPVHEQERLVREADRLLSVARHLVATVTTNIERSTRLRQSILKWAFEGKLVDQDPNDEPASALLARIRAERESTPTAPRTRARSPSPRAKKATKKS